MRTVKEYAKDLKKMGKGTVETELAKCWESVNELRAAFAREFEYLKGRMDQLEKKINARIADSIIQENTKAERDDLPSGHAVWGKTH